ncbi:hypothetical protein N7504_004347 [Penicillium tannophilum]|nr:hypothetical protein N7504_004347 [Penicillium tannophilum]
MFIALLVLVRRNIQVRRFHFKAYKRSDEFQVWMARRPASDEKPCSAVYILGKSEPIFGASSHLQSVAAGGLSSAIPDAFGLRVSKKRSRTTA